MTYVYPLPEDYAESYAAQFPNELDEDPGTLRWFGRPWPSEERMAPVCRPDTHAPTPVGYWCTGCGDAISQSDNGVIIPSALTPARARPFAYYGLECFLASIGLPPTLPWRDSASRRVVEAE